MKPAPASLPGAAPLKLLACAAFFSAAALRVCDSLLPQLARDFGRTAGETGQVIVGFSVAYGLMQLVFGPLGDRYGRQRLVCAALWACAASAGACALAADFPALVLGRIAWGMAGAGIVVDSTGYAPLLAVAALALPLAGWGLATAMRCRTPAAG